MARAPPREPKHDKREIHCKYICLTYSKCDIEPNVMLEILKERLKNNRLKYILIAQEHHVEEGVHLHVYIELATRIRCGPEKFWVTVNEKTFTGHLREAFKKDGKVGEGRWGWIEYVRKEGFVIVEWGIAPVKPIKKKTKQEINKLMTSGKEQMLKLVDDGEISLRDFTRYVAGLRMYERLKHRVDKSTKWRNVTVKWFWGKTGTGKTSKAIDEAEEAGEEVWVSDGKQLDWFDEYDGQKYVIFDELRGDTCKWAHLLRLLDGNRIYVQIKGGWVPFCPTHIYITSPKPPEQVFVNHTTGQSWDSIDQLLRRISEIKDFNEEPYECKARRLLREAEEKEVMELAGLPMEEELADASRKHDKEQEVLHPIPLRLPSLTESSLINRMEDCSSLTDLELTPTWESDK